MILRKTDLVMGALFLLGVVVELVVLSYVNGCTPAEKQNRITEGRQAGELGVCITEAAKIDAGHDERYAWYTKCADEVDRDAGRKP